MADFLEAVDSDSGKKEPTPVTLVSAGAEVGTSGNPLPIAAGSGENFIGKVGGTTARVTASFARPADTTQYTSGDLVANSTTAGSVTPIEFTVARVAAGSGMIRRARIGKSGTGITSASFRLHLYSASPTVTNGDNGVWLSNQAANYIGAIDVTVDKAFSDGAAGNGIPQIGSDINFKLDSGKNIYALLEARGAYTPISKEQFSIALEVLQD